MDFPISRRERRPGMLPFNWEAMEKLFENMWKGFPLVQSSFSEECCLPLMNLFEKEGRLFLTAEVPGMRKEDIEISLDNRTLTISGKKEPEKEEKGATYYLKESPDGGGFSRTLQLPAEVDPDRIEAKVKDGVLIIMMAKKTGPQPTKIEIKE